MNLSETTIKNKVVSICQYYADDITIEQTDLTLEDYDLSYAVADIIDEINDEFGTYLTIDDIDYDTTIDEIIAELVQLQ